MISISLKQSDILIFSPLPPSLTSLASLTLSLTPHSHSPSHSPLSLTPLKLSSLSHTLLSPSHFFPPFLNHSLPLSLTLSSLSHTSSLFSNSPPSLTLFLSPSHSPPSLKLSSLSSSLSQTLLSHSHSPPSLTLSSPSLPLINYHPHSK